MIDGHCIIEEEGANFRDFFKEFQVYEALEEFFDNESMFFTEKKVDPVFVFSLTGKTFGA